MWLCFAVVLLINITKSYSFTLKNTLKLRFERCDVFTAVSVTSTLFYCVMLSLFRRNIAAFTFVVHNSGGFLKYFLFFLFNPGIFLSIH